MSEDVAASANIEFIVDDFTDMLGQVDALLLARDDSANHKEFAAPFLRAGVPIFIDKPLSNSVAGAKELLGLQRYSHQLFSCSALRFADTLRPRELRTESITEIRAVTPKYWSTYSVHIIEPIVAWFPDRGPIVSIEKMDSKELGGATTVLVSWARLRASFTATNQAEGLISMEYRSENSIEYRNEIDSFFSFKSAIQTFVMGIERREVCIPRQDTLEIIRIIEHGS